MSKDMVDGGGGGGSLLAFCVTESQQRLYGFQE